MGNPALGYRGLKSFYNMILPEKLGKSLGSVFSIKVLSRRLEHSLLPKSSSIMVQRQMSYLTLSLEAKHRLFLPKIKRPCTHLRTPLNSPFLEPLAPDRHCHITRKRTFTVAFFRIWRGSRTFAVWNPSFNAFRTSRYYQLEPSDGNSTRHTGICGF